MTGLRSIIALLVLGSSLDAQESWDIPHRGALVYARKTQVFEVQPPPSKLEGDRLIVPASDGGHEWRYLSCDKGAIPKDFANPKFDDSTWALGFSEFGPDAKAGSSTRTAWKQTAVCLRTGLQLARKPKALVFDVHHDDGIKIWLNGTVVVSNNGYGRNKRYVVAGKALSGWKRGPNVLAAQCINVGGAQYFDLALTALHRLPRGVRKQASIQKALSASKNSVNKTRRELFAEFRPPAVLLQGDLDDDQVRARIPPADLRDIAWWIATDLRFGKSGGSVRAESYRMFRLGDLDIKGRAGVVDEQGWQTIRATVKNLDEPKPRDDSKRHVDRFVNKFVLYGFDGELEIRRKLEIGAGAKARVIEFETVLHGRVLKRKDKKWKAHVANLEQRETWKLKDVRDGQDAGFRKLVADSIERGIKRIKEQLKEPEKGNTAAEKADSNRTYNTGRLALALMSLVKAGVPTDDPIIKKGYDELRKRRIIDTYSLGNALMALAALYAPKSELSDLKSGILGQPSKRRPSPEDRELMQKWTDVLLGNIDGRVDPAYLLRFHYIGANDYDNSVNQYGLLGLYSAHLCGIEIPAQVWEAAANHLITCQSPDGKRRTVTLVDYGTMAMEGDNATPIKFQARIGGWNYKDGKSGGELTPTWGSMTAAGITGLAICQAALSDYPQIKRGRLLKDIGRSRRDGFAWLAEYMTMRCHAGAIERQGRWYYYYTYSLERAALLSGIALIQDRDWYFECAMMLALAQKADGNWPGELQPEQALETNAMALLTMVQSTRPVITGPR
ncbi:MAG: hypothetical protein NXI31_01975 [bacterium]|nr:hypothetical protein [bacterium]